MKFFILSFFFFVFVASVVSCSGPERVAEGIAIVDEESDAGEISTEFLEEIRGYISKGDFVQARASVLEARELFGSSPNIVKLMEYIQKQFERRKDVDAKNSAKLSAVSSYVEAILSCESGENEKSLREIETSISHLKKLAAEPPVLKSVLRAKGFVEALVGESCLALAAAIQRKIQEASNLEDSLAMLSALDDARRHPELCERERGRILSAVEAVLAEQMRLFREEERFLGCSGQIPFYRMLCQKFPDAISCRDAESRIETCSKEY